MLKVASTQTVQQTAVPPPCTLVVFGAAGDLTKRLLVPALYNLAGAKLLPERFAVIGIARGENDDESFRHYLAESTRTFAGSAITPATWDWLAPHLHYLRGDFDTPETYKKLADALKKADAAHQTGGNVVFYMATPPAFFAPIVRRLAEAGLTREDDGRYRRVIVEKPFGTDLASARALNRDLLAALSENQIYRIDHYLGKETVQNMMVFRFANGLFEPLWNRDHIDHVQITVAETVDVGQRGKFYDATGALRDMVPNHLFQLLSLAAMEPPTCFDAEAVRAEKTKALCAVHTFGPEDARRNVVRGQYSDGKVGGRTVEAYRRAANVDPQSTTETYIAMKLAVDNWRWAGVPFYLRTGKALKRRRSELVIQFKQAPLSLFRDTPVERLTPNDLVLHIQPEQGVSLFFNAKIPGPSVRTAGVEMAFNYQDHFKTVANTGYETLIYDCMIGDATLFKRADDIEAGWSVVQPVLDGWQADRKSGPSLYAAGSEGPADAAALLTRDGRHWRTLE
ncbi:MAG TPA: glucose-6-phosphate dehydrogenase [Pseudolabrys sp.]|nr:glucose-6-phosphate dehydrogenase [Pseudolabrys sp.]